MNTYESLGIQRRASAPIRALACGYSSRARAKKLMTFIQGFVDDSSSDVGDQRMFLVAYINTVEQWEMFADAWKKELEKGGLDYFKMVEANALRGQFGGWVASKRDAKVLELAKIIAAHRPWFVFCSVSRKEYAEILGPVSPHGLKHPYFLCFWGVIKTTARYHQMFGDGAPPVDFIFDEQGGLGDDAALWYRWLKEDEDSATRNVLGATPIFRDDKDMVALQAADMLAWHLRKDHEVGGLDDRTVLDLLICGEGAGVHFPKDVMQEIAPRMSRVPGLSDVQTKKHGRQATASARALVAAGAPSPRTDIGWMRYVAFRVWIERAWRRWRWLRRMLFRGH